MTSKAAYPYTGMRMGDGYGAGLSSRLWISSHFVTLTQSIIPQTNTFHWGEKKQVFIETASTFTFLPTYLSAYPNQLPTPHWPPCNLSYYIPPDFLQFEDRNDEPSKKRKLTLRFRDVVFVLQPGLQIFNFLPDVNGQLYQLVKVLLHDFKLLQIQKVVIPRLPKHLVQPVLFLVVHLHLDHDESVETGDHLVHKAAFRTVQNQVFIFILQFPVQRLDFEPQPILLVVVELDGFGQFLDSGDFEVAVLGDEVGEICRG